ncbi:ROK family protein [Streptomyces sp. YU58]|uniref:ROK family protein n=1 Tax=Streptomyces sp. SX92 TaxID=3158972 RepID=UPI0027BA7200|nr:ROK family protein [Streptomyces coralus]
MAGGRDLAGVPGPAGGPKTAGVSGSAGVSGLAGGPESAGGPGLDGVPDAAGVSEPAGAHESAGAHGSAGVPEPNNVRDRAGTPDPAGVSELTGSPARAGVSGPAGVPDPVEMAEPTGVPAPDRAPSPAGVAGLDALLGVGVALPGPLDHVRGVLHRVTGFPEWDGFPLRAALERRLGVPVVVDKDTNAAALGLAVSGEGGPGGSFAYLHLGTGLGAGLVIGGAVHRGARTRAGEFGHQVIQLDGPLCGCGNRGCVEALCLGAVARGEAAEAARVLGEGAANLVELLDIDLVLLGGRTVLADPEAFVRGVSTVIDGRARSETTVPVRIAPGGVAEGAAQLLLAPLFGQADG